MMGTRKAMLTTLMLLVFQPLAALATGESNVAGQVCPTDTNILECAQTLHKFVPKFEVEKVSSGFSAAGWKCSDYDFEKGFMCRGRVAGYPDDIAVFIPRRYIPKPKAPLVLHLHGNLWEGATADDVLKRYDFGTILAKSNRRSLLIVPLSQAHVTAQNHPEMRDPVKFQQMMDSLMALFQKAGLCEHPEPAHIALTAHSGGYKTSAAILSMACPKVGTCYRSHIHEFHLLDGSYGEDTVFTNFALERGNRFTTTYIPDTQTEETSLNIMKQVPGAKLLTTNSQRLKDKPDDYLKYDDENLKAQNPAFVISDVDHNAVVTKYMHAMLFDSKP
jgi:hypothetical protein